ncbi:sensor histidine kinase [Leucobacter sp. BZR 635]
MNTHSPEGIGSETKRPRARLYSPAMVGRDLGYILPGFPIAVVSFSLLLTLTVTSISTLIIWVGVPLLALSLVLATTFAELSRARLRWWGAAADTPPYLERGPGSLGMLRFLRDPRRWLDLAFETLVAFPLRIFSFVVTISWAAAALGALTWVFWGYFLPRNENPFPANFLLSVSEGAIPLEVANSFWVESVFYALCGIAAAASFPPLARGLAVLDATVTQAALCSDAGHLARSFAVPAAAPSAPHASPASHPAAARLGIGGTGRTLGSAEGWAWIITGYAAIILIAVGWPLLATLYSVHAAFAMVLVIAQAAALMLAIRLPALAIAVAMIAPAVAAALSPAAAGVPAPWPVSMMIVQTGIVLIVALRFPWPWALAAWVLPQATVIATVPSGSGFTSGAVANLVVTASITLGIALLGIIIRAFAADRGALVEERRANAELDAKQRELAERNLIARELHDVVAHSMSVVSIQANTAKYRIAGLGDEAEAEFAAIAQSSRQALTEMRGLLATLRAPEGSAPLVPQPTLADLPTLIESSRQSGATIAYRAEGLEDAPGEASEAGAGGGDAGSDGAGSGGATVPASTALTTYRIAQEALSNAMRHSPGADIDVTVRVTDAAVTVAVVNGPASMQVGSPVGSGTGLNGLRERAAVLGGSIEASPTPDGGFAVYAVLPL